MSLGGGEFSGETLRQRVHHTRLGTLALPRRVVGHGGPRVIRTSSAQRAERRRHTLFRISSGNYSSESAGAAARRVSSGRASPSTSTAS